MKMDKLLLILTIFMFSLGLLMIFSASSVQASLSGTPYAYFIKQALTLAVCGIIFIVVTNIPLIFYKRTSFLIVLIVVASLIAVYLYGSILGGAKSWIDLGFYNYQPSEFAKTALILYMAVYYNKHKDDKSIIQILKPIIIAIIICAFTYIQPDLGTTAIIVFITGLIFFSLPIENKFKKTLVQFALLTVAIVLVYGVAVNFSFLHSGQQSRLDFQNPCTKYLSGGTGYQVCNGFIAINHGGLLGVGLGNSTQKYLYLPAAHTDFIFAIILEELGLVTGIVIIIIYMIILIRIMRIAFKSYNLMGSVIAYGTALYLFIHIIINLGGVLAIIPLTGVPLPFLSYGGSYALNLCILLALVQRVEIENKQKSQLKMLREGKE